MKFAIFIQIFIFTVRHQQRKRVYRNVRYRFYDFATQTGKLQLKIEFALQSVDVTISITYFKNTEGITRNQRDSMRS